MQSKRCENNPAGTLSVCPSIRLPVSLTLRFLALSLPSWIVDPPHSTEAVGVIASGSEVSDVRDACAVDGASMENRGGTEGGT